MNTKFHKMQGSVYPETAEERDLYRLLNDLHEEYNRTLSDLIMLMETRLEREIGKMAVQGSVSVSSPENKFNDSFTVTFKERFTRVEE